MGFVACRRSPCKQIRSSCGAKGYRLCILWGASLVSLSAADFAERQQIHGTRIGGERRTVLRREEVESKMRQEPPAPLHDVVYNTAAPSSAGVSTGPLKTRVVSLESSVSDLLSRTISLEDEVLGRTTRGAHEYDGVDAASHRGGAAGNSSAAVGASPKVLEVVLVEPPANTIGIDRLTPAAQSHGHFGAKLAAGVQMARLPIGQGLLLEQVPTTQLPSSTTVAVAAPLTTAAPSGQTTMQAAPLPPATPAPAESQSGSSLWFLLLAIGVCLVLCGVLMHRRGVVTASSARRSTIRDLGGEDSTASTVLRREFQKGRFSVAGGDVASIRRGSRASAFGQTVDAARRSKYANVRESRSGGNSTSQSPAATPRQMSSGHNSAGSGGGSGGSTTPPLLERGDSAQLGQTRYSQRRLKKSMTEDPSSGTGSGSKNTPTPPLPDLSDASVGSAAP